MKPIIVIGSANMDHLIRVPRLPQLGETLRGDGVHLAFGGKGANQAVAAARLGARVKFLGCVGSDAYGPPYLDQLNSEGIDTSLARIVHDTPTGCAYINIDRNGQNCIVVIAGANEAVSPSHVRAAAPEIARAGTVLLQQEIPLESVRAAIDVAHEAGVPIVLNCSPMPDDLSHINAKIACLIVNEVEAMQIAGMHLEQSGSPALDVAGYDLLERGVRSVVITNGAGPTTYAGDHGVVRQTPPSVVPVDTVGAGDCFAGAFAVAILEQIPPEEAVRFSNAAAALATQAIGAQTSMPHRTQVNDFMHISAHKERHYG